MRSERKMVVHADYSRRFPDPLNKQGLRRLANVEHHILLCKAANLPDGIPTTPNPRAQKTDKAIYKEVRESLLDLNDTTFHLKNKGITVIAKKVIPSEDKRSVEILFGEEDGIVDGAHTYKIILENRDDCPPNQYVKVELLTGIPQDMVEPIAGGLNTAVQVQAMSLANLAHKFDWIKELLQDEQYAGEIAYKENEDGQFSIRDIVALMTLFNIGLKEFKKGGKHPKEAYTSKAVCLEYYIKHEKSYRKLKGLLKDILDLYDMIHLEGQNLYNTKYKGKAGRLAFYQSRKRGEYKFVFTNNKKKFRLYDGALYPILGSFRFLVEESDGVYEWKTGSFEGVKKIWREIGADLIHSTKVTSDSRDRNPNAIGKDENHWDNLYKTVALAYLQKTIK